MLASRSTLLLSHPGLGPAKTEFCHSGCRYNIYRLEKTKSHKCISEYIYSVSVEIQTGRLAMMMRTQPR